MFCQSVSMHLKSTVSPGSNANFGRIFATTVPCLIAYSCLVSFLLEQRVWESIFVTIDGTILNFQTHICCWKGKFSITFWTHFYYYILSPDGLSVISLPCLTFLFDVEFRCNPSLLLWKHCHVKRCIMGHMQHQSR